jgi:hypothetical protein
VTQPSMPLYLRRAAAAKYVRDRWGVPCATRTLAKIACVASDGPEMHYAGRVPLYTIEALDMWASNKIGPPRRSTSDRPHLHHGGRPKALVRGDRSPREA